jgi:hypothetical protein
VTVMRGSRLSEVKPWRLLSYMLLVVLLPTAARMALDSGRTWDEQVQLEYGDLVLAWFRSHFTDQGALTYANLYLYGGLFDLPAQWLNSTHWLPWGPYETRHVLSALVACLGVVAAWLTADRIAGPRAGLLAAVMIALTPTWVGHGLFNPKDIPFGAAAAFVAYATTRVAMGPAVITWGDTLRVGLTLGLALGVRSGGMFLAGYPFLAGLARLALDASARARQGEPLLLRRTAIVVGRLLCSVPLAWALMISAWPWAQLDPLQRPLEAAGIAAHFHWGGVMRFNGRMISTEDLPASYLPIWFKVTLPDTYALAAVCAIIALVTVVRTRRIDRLRALAIAILSLFVLAPLAAVVITRPTIYDAHRHFLFLMPVMAVLAGLAIDAVVANMRLPSVLRLAVAVLAVGLASLTLHDIWVLHPYEYVYFNRLSGGLRRQGARFETDYWGASYREGFDWVVHHIDPDSSKRVVVAACEGDNQLRYYRAQWNVRRFQVPKKPAQAEIFLSTRRSACGSDNGELLYTVEREGVPLLFVRRRPEPLR